MPRGTNPRSLENLTRDGRPQKYDEPKKDKRLTITKTGWEGAKSLTESMGMSVSEFLEQLGRGQITIIHTAELEAIEDTIDSALLRQAIAETQGEFMSVDQVLAERDLSRAALDG